MPDKNEQDNKRVKRFSNIDELLLHPGEAIEYMEQLRTQIYYMQKKLRRQSYKVQFQDIQLDDADATISSAMRLVGSLNSILQADALVREDTELLEAFSKQLLEEEETCNDVADVSEAKAEALREKFSK